MKLKIFYSQIGDVENQFIQRALLISYKDILDVIIGGELELVKEAYNAKRDQYNADVLLKHLLKTKKEDIALWVIEKDIYCTGMNFIFGYAMYNKGALLSIHRLSSLEMVEKEAIHEIGHVLGLKHCRNNCVMQFSNSLWDAKMKPSYLCKSCIRNVRSLHNY